MLIGGGAVNIKILLVQEIHVTFLLINLQGMGLRMLGKEKHEFS